jgi:hypothetical protein
MNMANSDYQEQDFDYQVDFERRSNSKDKTPRQRRFQYARSNRPAVSHNGIHRRRNKRFSW